jgi:predicted DNA-binding transcriptional regulator AlpA
MTSAPTPPPIDRPGRPRQMRGKQLDVKTRPVVSADEAFALLEIDRSTGYKAIKDGTFPVPVLRIGRVIRIPTAALLRLLDPSGDTRESQN